MSPRELIGNKGLWQSAYKLGFPAVLATYLVVNMLGLYSKQIDSNMRCNEKISDAVVEIRDIEAKQAAHIAENNSLLKVLVEQGVRKSAGGT